MTRSLAAAALLALACALPVSAQTTYAAPGDTLRFREVLKGKVLITTPQGEMTIALENHAKIGVLRLRGDSARAWYDSLAITASTPGGDMHPAADSVLGKPFRLGFDPRGRVRLAQAPKFPASFEGLADLAHQFDDFFLRLPAQPLKVGFVWSDSVSWKDSTAGKTTKWASNADYRVERDTVVDGVAALVVRMKQRVRIGGEGPVPNQPMRAESALEGTEDGYFVFAPRTGRMLARRREGQLAGDVTMRGQMGEMSMKQAFSYTGTIDAVR